MWSSLCNPFYLGQWVPGVRPTKAYDVTIQRYRNSLANIENSEMHILRCMVSKFCVKFQMAPILPNSI